MKLVRESGAYHDAIPSFYHTDNIAYTLYQSQALIPPTQGVQNLMGMVERKGRVIAKVVPDVQGSTPLPLVKEKVLDRSVVYTDELKSYNPLSRPGAALPLYLESEV